MGSFLDLTGQIFGRLTVVERAPNLGGRTSWRCVCQCGDSIVTRASSLRAGHTNSCGCLVRENSGRSAEPVIDLTGKEFGRLIVLERAPNDPRGHARWLCRCECGNETTVRGAHLRIGATKSCGCLKVEWAQTFAHLTPHGHNKSNARRSPEYHSWYGMKQRCQNSNHQAYYYYGGRGITVCERWQKFEQFLEDMGPRPADTSLDRIDPNGNYEPGNCRWADAKTQGSNRRKRA